MIFPKHYFFNIKLDNLFENLIAKSSTYLLYKIDKLIVKSNEIHTEMNAEAAKLKP